MAVTPLVESAVITSGLALAVAVDQVAPPSVEYWYERMALPPVDGAEKATLIVWLPRVVVVMVGCPGTVAGVPDRAADGGRVTLLRSRPRP